MVKPQFEVGKDRVGKGGVVRDPGAAGGGRQRVSPTRPRERGWGAVAVTVSPLPGPSGQRRVLPVAAARPADDRCGRDPRRGRARGSMGVAGERVAP